MKENVSMNAGRAIATIAAAILIFFGVLFIWGAFSESGNPGWIVIGVIGITAGLGLIWLTRRGAQDKSTVEIIQKIELSGDIELDSLQCEFCGGPLGSEDIKMVAGAPVVKCPYCGSSYQITEKPKW